MLAEDKGHTLGQVGREQGVDVVIRRGVGYGGQAQILGIPRYHRISRTEERCSSNAFMLTNDTHNQSKREPNRNDQ
jgi:hypothetical protein